MNLDNTLIAPAKSIVENTRKNIFLQGPNQLRNETILND